MSLTLHISTYNSWGLDVFLLRFNKPVIDAPSPESLTKTTISVSTLLDSSMDKPLKENGWDSLLKVLQRHTIER